MFLLLINGHATPISVKRYERLADGKVKVTHSAELPDEANDVVRRHLNEFLKQPEAFVIWQPDQAA